MSKKIFTTKEGFKVEDIDEPLIGINDVLIEVISSFYSPGTEGASAKRISESIFKKSLRFKDQIKELISKGEFNLLYKKLINQQNTKLTTGYSIFGKVINVGENVNKLRTGQYVVCLGEKANHGSIAVVPQGMVFPCNYNIDYSCISLLSIALNSSIIGNFKPFSKILVIGGGLLGQFIIQILNQIGHEPSVIEIRDELKEVSIKHGVKKFFRLDDFELYKNEFDGVISTLPNLTKTMWEKVALMTKPCSNIVLVGASDLNISRSVFYPKRLTFLTAYSYGSGRGEFQYEYLSNHNETNLDSGPKIKTLVNKSLKLIDDNKINIDFVEKVDLSRKTGVINEILNKKKLGFNFIWDGSKKKKEADNQIDLIDNKHSNTKFNGIDLIGYSAFFRDSHLPALNSLNIKVGGIRTRSPKSNSNSSLNLKTNSLIISTPHIEHWNNIKESISYDFIFIDKPIVTNQKEYLEYLQHSNKIIALMNRRYSDYTIHLKNFISKNPENAVLNFSFNVPEKNNEDQIYFSGGRLIGEMCHHVDLAVHLSGEVSSFEKIILDNDVDAQKSEDCQLILKHTNGAISKIFYSTNYSPFWEKEAIWATIKNHYVLIKDFKSIVSNFNRSVKIRETDKGCYNMWRIINKKLKSNSSFDDFIKLDKMTYEILSEILF